MTEKQAKTDDYYRQLWKKHGGSFHGPRVETATMPEADWLKFMRLIDKAEESSCFVNPYSSRVCLEGTKSCENPAHHESLQADAHVAEQEHWETLNSRPASEPAAASAPSCCGEDEPTDDMVLAAYEATENWGSYEKTRAALKAALRARAQPCQCGELREALECARIKLARYREQHGEAHIGGVAAEYDATVKLIDRALAATAPRSGDKDGA